MYYLEAVKVFLLQSFVQKLLALHTSSAWTSKDTLLSILFYYHVSPPKDKMINVIICPVFFSYPKHIHHSETSVINCNYHVDVHDRLMHSAV